MTEPGNIHQLFPPNPVKLPLEGLYLGQNLRALSGEDRPFVYSNYVLSLDGRIAVSYPSKPGLTVPPSVANERDWRLFQELAVQADVILTSGRYLRDYAEGRAQEILRVHEDPRFSDLARWRQEQGLNPLPDLAVVSDSLDFPLPEALFSGGRRIFLVTSRVSKSEKAKNFPEGIEWLVSGDDTVGGQEMVRRLHARGARLIYNATGPKVLHLLLEADVLDRLYLTYTGRILGGEEYATIVEGHLLERVVDFRLSQLYLDEAGTGGLSQMFATYDLVEKTALAG